MGNKALSVISKPFKNFNIESRAHKIISQEKPTVAPRFKSNVQDYERFLKENPNVIEEESKKDDVLDRHLRDVFVTSQDPSVVTRQNAPNPERSLPLDKKPTPLFDLGFKEPTKVPLGKVTLRKAIQFITNHHADPKVYTVSTIANEHLLPEETVDQILKYFRSYEIYIPQQRKVDATFLGPAVKRRQVVVETRKQLPRGKDDVDNT